MKRIIERALYGASKPVVQTYAKTMLDINFTQKSPFPAGAKIIAPNHPSTTDPFFVAALLGHQSYIMINDVLFQVPILGAYLRRSGHISVKPGHGQEAIDEALEHLRAGHTIVIFPEGLICPLCGGFNKPRTGVARLAIESGAPVFPVGIHLLRNLIKSRKSVVKGKEEIAHWYPSGPYNVTIGEPMLFSGSVDDHEYVKATAEQIMKKIRRLALESEQRWTRSNRPLPGAFEVI